MPSDFKRGPRIKNPEALKRFRLAHLGEPCEDCRERPGTQVHHVIFKGQQGDDVPDNFRWLCIYCHGKAHGVRYV